AGAGAEEFADSVARDGVGVAVAPSGLLLSEALEAGLVDPTSGMVRVPGTADETMSLSDAVDSGLISGDQSMVLDTDTGRFDASFVGRLPAVGSSVFSFAPLFRFLESGLPVEYPGLVSVSSSLDLHSLISQLRMALDKESGWILECEEDLLRMGAVTLDDISNRQLVDDHQACFTFLWDGMKRELLNGIDLLDRARQRQSEVRAVLFQAEQFLQSHQNTVSAAQRDPLNTHTMEIRERLDRIQREAEFRVRTLISSLDELEHLTDKLQTVRKLLDRCDKGVIKSLTDRSCSNLLLTSYDDLTQLVPRLHTILAQAQAAQLEVNNLPQLARTFLASVNRYNTSKSAFRASLNRPSRDQVQPTEDNRDLERTVLTAVHEADERLCALTNSVQGRIRSIQEASDQYQLFSDELVRLRSGLDHIEAEYQKSLSCSDPMENFGDQLSTAQRRKVQMQLDALFASAAELNTLGCALRNLQHHSVESLYDHLVQAGLSADVTSEIVRRPIDVELERRTNLYDLIHQRSRKLAQLLADKQTVTETLTASMRWADKIEKELSNLDLTPADDADHRLSLAHRVQAELEAHQTALQAARLRVDGVVNDAKSEPGSVSEADVTTAQAFTKQINQLEQRLNTIRGLVHTNLDSLTGSMEVLDQGRRKVDDLNTWITQTFDSLDQAQLSRLRDNQLSDKLVEIKKEIFSRRKQLEDLQDLVSRLPSSSPIPMNQELQFTVDAVEKRLIELENVLHTSEKDLEQRKSQHKPFTEALERVSDWLDNFEGRSNSLPTIAVSTRLVQQQLVELEPLLSEWRAHESDITGVEKLGAAYDRLRDQLGTEGAISEVAYEVEDLRERYTHLGSKLTDRKTELEATAQDLQALEQNYQGLIEWLDKRVQPLVGQNERLTSLQALSEASSEAQRIHDEISGGMSSLDDFREQASAVLRNRDYANGASELRATVTNIERHWAVAVNLATERHNSLELLLKDITEFKRLHARLLQELKQKSLLISHAAQSTDQLSPDRIRAELERLRQLQTALDNLTPEIERLDSSGHRLLGRLPETIATDLQIPQTVREIRTEHEQLRAPISAFIDKLSACLGPKVQFEELLERANVFLSPLQPILSSTDIDRARLAVARDRLEQARELLAEASQLGDRLVAATDDPTEQFDLKTKLLKVQQLLDKTDVTISMKSSGKSEVDLPGYTKMAELCEWMSEKSKQIQEVDEAIRQQTHGLYPLQSAVLVDRIEAMQTIVEEIKQKSDDLKHLQKPDVPHGCKPVIIDPIKTAMEQLRLLQRAVQDKRSQLQAAMDHPITAHTRLNQLEAWIADRNHELSEPVVPTSGTYLSDPGRFTVIEDRMNSIMSEVEAQLIALSQLKLDGSDLGNERLRAQRVEAFTHRTESLRNQLQHVHDAAQNRMLQMQKVNQHLTAAQDAVQEYRAAADEAETRWISVQQDLCKSGAHPASHISSSIPSQEEFHRLQMDLFNLLDESVPVESVDEVPVSLRMINSVQNLEYSLKAVGDGDPRRSVGGLLADVANTRKRLEAIVNSLNSDLGTATETAESNQTVALIKQLNAVSRQLRNADEVLSAYPTAFPGLDPQTLRERARNLSETTQSLTDCKESLDKLRAQLQPTVTPSRTPMPSSDWLAKLDKLEKETMNLVNQAYNANENISTRLAQSEQLAQLRENLSQSVRRARDACLSPPQSPSPIPDGAEATVTDPEDLVHKITEDLRVLSNLSRHLSASSADDTVQRHLELELKAAGDAVEELHSNLRMTTGRQRNLSAARLDQVEKGIKRLRTILEEIAEDWRAQSELTVKSGEDQARQRDNYRLMYARTMTHANSVEQLDGLLRLVSGSPESSAAVSDDMRTEVAQLREAYHELAEHIQTHLSRSTDAEQAQQALQDRIQIAMTWLQQKQNQMEEPASPVDPKYASDSQLVNDIRADSKQVRKIVKELDGYRSIMDQLKTDADVLITSGKVLDTEAFRDRVSAACDLFEEVYQDARQRAANLEIALPLVQRMSIALHTLSLRLPAAAMKLGQLEESTEPVHLKRIAVDQLEVEASAVLAPQGQIVHQSWEQLKRLPVSLRLAERPISGTTSSTDLQVVKLTDHIETELANFDSFMAKLSTLAREVQSTRQQSSELVTKLDTEANWLTAALRRLDPNISEIPSSMDGDAEAEEGRFAELTGSDNQLIPEESKVLDEYPSLAVLPCRPDQLNQLHNHVCCFRQAWRNRQAEKTNALLSTALGLLQASGLRPSSADGKAIVGNKIARQLVLSVDTVNRMVAQLETGLGSVEAKVEEARPLSKAYHTDLEELNNWLDASEVRLDELASPGRAQPSAEGIAELDMEREWYQQTKSLVEDVDRHKALLDRVMRTSEPLMKLTARSQIPAIQAEVKQASDRYFELCKSSHVRLNRVETSLKQSDEIAEQLNVMTDLFANIADQAAHLGVPILATSLQTKPAPSTVEIIAGEVQEEHVDSGLPAEPLSVGRLRPMTSVHPDQLEEQLNEANILVDTLNQRLPELEALTACVRAQLQPSLVARSAQLKSDNADSIATPVDPFAADSVLRNAEKLQTDWMELRAQLQLHVEKLTSAHKISSNEFWPTVNALQASLVQVNETARTIAAGCSPTIEPPIRRDLLDPHSYIEQRADLDGLLEQADELGSKLKECQQIGNRLVELVTGFSSEGVRSGFQLRRDEEQAIRNEVNYTIRDLEAFHDEVVTGLHRVSKKIDKQETAAKTFKVNLNDFLHWLSAQETRWDQMEPIGNDSAMVLRQLDEAVKWNEVLLNKHSDLENLNWAAGQLTSVDTEGVDSAADTSATTALSTMTSVLHSDLAGANRRWDQLFDSSNHRRHRLQTVLLGLGEFEQAMDALMNWIVQTQANVDQIPIRRGNVRGLEADLARVKVIHNNINNHQMAVVRLQEQAKKRIDEAVPPKDDEELTSQKKSRALERLDQLTVLWDQLKAGTRIKQSQLEEALRETFNFHADVDRLMRRCKQLERRMPGPGVRIMGGLPDSAREQLRRFNEVYEGLLEVDSELQELRKNSAALLVSVHPTDQPSEQLTGTLDRLTDHHTQLLHRATEIKRQLEVGLTEVERFHADLARMMQWLTSMERTMAQQKPVSRVVARLGQLILTHTELRREINSHREALMNLDRMGAQVQCNAQKQDVILVKNLLASIHSRWEQLLSRTAERTRQLNIGFKEAHVFLNNWTALTDWLKEQLTCLEESNTRVATRPDKVAHQLAQHREFQRALGSRNIAFDAVRRYARHMRDRAPACDHAELDDMISELKHLWHEVCSKALDRQRMLEQSLLSAGLYKEAIEALGEWLTRTEPQLSDHQMGIYGDVETVEQLMDVHKHFIEELKQRAVWIHSVREAAQELMEKASSQTSEVTTIQTQLQHVNAMWDRVQLLAQSRCERLEDALKLAVQFQEMCRSLMDYFAGAEHVIRRLAALPTYDDVSVSSASEQKLTKPVSNSAPVTLSDAIEAHQRTHTNLMEQADRLEAALRLGNQLLTQAHPEAVPRLRQWIHTIQTRWTDLTTWSSQRGDRLRLALEEQQKRRIAQQQLLEWLADIQVKLEREPVVAIEDILDGNSIVSSGVDMESQGPRDGDILPLHTNGDQNKATNAPSSIGESLAPSSYRTLSLHEINEPELVERLLAEHAETEKEFESRKPDYDAVIKHSKRRQISKLPVPSITGVAASNKPGRGAMVPFRTGLPRTPFGRGLSRQETAPTHSESPFVSPSVNELYSRWNAAQRTLQARRTRLQERLAYLSEVEKMKDFDFEEWRRRYVGWLNSNKARVIDLFHRKDQDRDGRLTRAEFIDGILEMNERSQRKFQTSRVELEVVADIFDANRDGYIDYRECLNALRAGYVAAQAAPQFSVYGGNSSTLSLNQNPANDEEAINDEVQRQVGLCTCHNTYQICKMTTNKYRFGDSQKLRLVRILRSAVMVRVGGGWISLDEFLSKNDPCRDACQRLSSISDLAAAVGLMPSSGRRRRGRGMSRAGYHHCNRQYQLQQQQQQQHSQGHVSSTPVVNPLRSSADSSISSHHPAQPSSLSTRYLRTTNGPRLNPTLHPISGPGQDNAFYLVMPDTRANPTNHIHKPGAHDRTDRYPLDKR
ncbi:Microtubule-actin cross-linking factor 1 isoforms 1/2/3/5, partial [Fasciola hepatica]